MKIRIMKYKKRTIKAGGKCNGYNSRIGNIGNIIFSSYSNIGCSPIWANV
jgi:hypothetical protein